VEVIYHHEHRLPDREVGKQPVQTVEHGEGRTGGPLGSRCELGLVEERPCEGRRTGHEVRAVCTGRAHEERLEQLANDSEGEPLLEFASPRGHHLKAGSFGGGPSLAEEPGLAHPHAALGDEQSTGTAASGAHQFLNRRHL